MLFAFVACCCILLLILSYCCCCCCCCCCCFRWLQLFVHWLDDSTLRSSFVVFLSFLCGETDLFLPILVPILKVVLIGVLVFLVLASLCVVSILTCRFTCTGLQCLRECRIQRISHLSHNHCFLYFIPMRILLCHGAPAVSQKLVVLLK